MAWIESHQELREHPKTKRLCRVLGLPRPMVVGYLHFLWWWAYDYAPEGDLSKFTDEDIADAVDWEGDPGALIAALVQCGFINEDRRLHDWEDFAQKWIERRQADRERKRAKRGKAPDIQEMSTGHPAEIHSLSGVTGPDRTGPDLTGPDPIPQPLPEEGESPPPAPPASGRVAGRRRRNGNGHEPSMALTSGDRERWGAATAQLARFIGPAIITSVVRRLEPIGRAEDGGLLLRAPPNIGIEARAMTAAIGRALEQVGDEAGHRAAIVE